MPTKTNTCKNCERNFEESFEFCPYCGQKANDKLTMKVLFHNTISNYFSVDARFLKSFVPLVIRPGFLPKRFVDGKRLTYLHPAQTYLFVSVIFFFLFSFEVSEQQQALNKTWEDKPETEEQVIYNDKNFYPTTETDSSEEYSIVFSKQEENDEPSQQNGKIDSLIAAGAPKIEIYRAMGMNENPSTVQRLFFEQVLKIKKRHASGLVQAFYNTFPIAMFFLMPIFAFLLKLFYFKKGAYAHHMVFSFYFFSFLFVVFSMLLILNFIWNLPGWLISLVLFSTYFYLLIGTKNFYEESYFVSFIKSSFVSFLFLLFVIPLSIGVMAFTAFMFY